MATGYFEFVKPGAQKKTVNQMAAASRESESFEGLSPIIGWNSDRREGCRHSLFGTESRTAERAIAQILTPVREIAARREGASQEPVVTKRTPRARIRKIWLAGRNPLHNHSLFSGIL
jgi:hypothetical protein